VLQLPPGKSYIIRAPSHGSVWVAIDGATVVNRGTSGGLLRVFAGDTGFVPGDRTATLSNEGSRPATLVIVAIKTAEQQPTVEAVFLKGEQELKDASERNETLLIAVSPQVLQDITNTGDESEWVPSKPVTLRLRPCAVTWIKGGTHHLKNLASAEARFVTIEW
jgi:hypothetical protein